MNLGGTGRKTIWPAHLSNLGAHGRHNGRTPTLKQPTNRNLLSERGLWLPRSSSNRPFRRCRPTYPFRRNNPTKRTPTGHLGFGTTCDSPLSLTKNESHPRKRMGFEENRGRASCDPDPRIQIRSTKSERGLVSCVDFVLRTSSFEFSKLSRNRLALHELVRAGIASKSCIGRVEERLLELRTLFKNRELFRRSGRCRRRG